MHLFKLFIAGHSQKNSAIIDGLHALFSEKCLGNYEMEIIDVFKNLQAVEDHFILATPTLIKQSPEPVERLLGDLSNGEKIISFFGLDN